MQSGQLRRCRWIRAFTLIILLSLVATACSWLNNEEDAVGCAERPEGLTNWWQLNQYDPDPAIEHLDFAGGVHGFDGDVSPTLAAAKVNDGAFADYFGSIDFAGGSSVLPSDAGFAVDAWVVLEGQDTEQTQNVLDSRDMSAGGRGIWFGIDEGRVHLTISDGIHTVGAHGGVVPLDAWHFIAASYDASSGEVELTMDDEVSTVSLSFPDGWTGKIETSTLGLHLHYGADTATQLHNTPARLGMDEIEFFDRPVSTSEFQRIYEAGPSGKCVSGIGDDPCITGTTLDDGTEYDLKSDFDLRAWWPFDHGSTEIEVAAWNSQPPMSLVPSPYVQAPVGKVDGALDVRGDNSWAAAERVSDAVDFGPNDDFSMDVWIRFDEDNPWVLEFGELQQTGEEAAASEERRRLQQDRVLSSLLSTNPETQMAFATDEVADLLDLEKRRRVYRDSRLARETAPSLRSSASAFPNGDEFDGYVIAERNFLQNINSGGDGWLIAIGLDGELYFYTSSIDDNGDWQPKQEEAFGNVNHAGGDPDLLDEEWHLIAITVDRTNDDAIAGATDPVVGHFFVDGEQEASFRLDSFFDFRNEAQITFGGVFTGTEVADEWPGILDEFEIFGVELPGAFIADLYAAGVNGKCKEEFEVVTSTWCRAEVWLEWESMWPLVTDPSAYLIEDYDLRVRELAAGAPAFTYAKDFSIPAGGTAIASAGPTGYPNIAPALQWVEDGQPDTWPPVNRYREQLNWDKVSVDTAFDVEMHLDVLRASDPNVFLSDGAPISGWEIGGQTWLVEKTNFAKIIDTPSESLTFTHPSVPFARDGFADVYPAGVLPCEGDTTVSTPTTTEVPVEVAISCGELPGAWAVGNAWTFTASVSPAGTSGSMEVNFDAPGGAWETMAGSYTIDQIWSTPGAKQVAIRFTPTDGGDVVKSDCGSVELEGEELQVRCGVELDRPQVGFAGIALAEVSPNVAGDMSFDFSDPAGNWVSGSLSGTTWESPQHIWATSGSKVVYARFTPASGGDPIVVICEPAEIFIEPNEEIVEEEETAETATTTSTTTTSTTTTSTTTTVPVVDFDVSCAFVPKEGARVFQQPDGTVFVPAGGSAQSLGFEATVTPSTVSPSFSWTATQLGSGVTKSGNGQLYDAPYDPGAWQLSVSASSNGVTKTATCPSIEIDG